MTQKKAALILWICIGVYTLLFIFLCFKKYDAFAYNGYDMSIFNQTFYNTLHGRWFDNTINFNNYLADHFSPILLLLLPIYAIYPSAKILLVMSTLVLALSSWPLFKITLYKTKTPALALLVGVLWLLNPFVHIANLTEFHLMYFAPLPIFFAAYYFIQKKFWPYALWFALSLLVREDMPFILFGFFLIDGLEKRSIKWLLFSGILPIAYFLGSLKIISLFSVFGGYKFFAYYSWLGGDDLGSILWTWITHPLQVIGHIFKLNNLINFASLFLPLLFLPWRKAKYLLLLLLPALQFALSLLGIASIVVTNYYVVLFLPAIFIAMAMSADVFQLEKGKIKFKIFSDPKPVFFALGVSAVYFLSFLSPVPQVLSADFDARTQSLRQAYVEKIPENSRVLSESVFTPRLTTRRYSYSDFYAYRGYSQFFHQEITIPELDYVLIDFESFITNQQLVGLEKYKVVNNQWEKFLSRYQLESAEDNIYLFSAKNENTADLALFDLVTEDRLEEGRFEGQIITSDNRRVLKLKTGFLPLDQDSYFIRMYRGDGSYITMPLDYGLWKFGQWPDKGAYIYYYPGQDMVSYQIFRGSATLALSRIQNITTIFDIEPLTPVVYLNTLKIIESEL